MVLPTPNARWPALVGAACGLLSLSFVGCGPMDGASPAPSAAAAAATGPAHLTVMTLNAEFLWDGIAPEDGDIDFEGKGDPERADAQMAAVADIIRRSDPDLVNLVEVEGPDALDRFNRGFLEDAGYLAYLVEGTDTATGQDVGLLSRFPVDSIGRDPRKGHSGRTRKGVSKHYVATLDVGGLRLGLVGLHLLARPDSKSRRGPREAQADAIARMAAELAAQGREVIVWGDFNDYDGAVPDAGDNRPISGVMQRIRAADPGDPSDDLVNASAHLPQRDRVTHRMRSKPALDHVLVSSSLGERIEWVRIPRDHDPQRVTAHYPVVVRFRLDGPGDPQR
ncbi:MAG: endonuclease/exonuclease/phosphatase family protein [Acidobacteriota bacterium]